MINVYKYSYYYADCFRKFYHNKKEKNFFNDIVSAYLRLAINEDTNNEEYFLFVSLLRKLGIMVPYSTKTYKIK